MLKKESLEDFLVGSYSINIMLAFIGIDAAIEKSLSMGVQTCISIMDPGGQQIAFARMDGAPLQSILLAESKAKSVAGNGLATHKFWELVQDQQSITLASSQIQGGNWIGGGVPVIFGEYLIATIGVSGRSSMSHDLEIALAAELAIIQNLSVE